MRKLYLAVAATAAVAISPVLAQQADQNQAFLKKAIEGNYAEVKMGELAQKNAKREGVKQFGETLAKDHGAANQKALALAKEQNVQAPKGPSKQQTATYNELAKSTGAAFDRAFLSHAVKDHQKDIAAYTKAAKGKQGPIADYAEETLPTLQQHLETAQSLQKSGSAATGAAIGATKRMPADSGMSKQQQ